jgi:superfamily II DNA or RNA helicase
MMAPKILKLRRYQEEALLAVASSWNTMRRPAVVLPTGAGKTVIFSHLAKAWVEGPRTRRRQVVILVHRDELVTQAVEKLRKVAPALTVGVVKGAKNEINKDVIVASVQTLSKPARLFPLIGKVGLVIVDECHHAAATSYMRVLEELGCFAPLDEVSAVAVGFTATMSRADSKALGDVWEAVVYTKDILDLIAAGYLANVRGKAVTIDGLTLDEVKKSRGDYQAQSLSDILQTSGAITAVADSYLEHAKGLPGLLFAPTVEAAHLFTEAFVERGVRTAPVWGSMGPLLRHKTLRRYEDGELDMLANCMVLTEGYDSPRATVAIIARPTTSAALYVQMVGRVLRPYPGKESALVMDVAGASAMHDLATLSDLTSQRVPEIMQGESLTEAAERAVKDGALDLAGDVGITDIDLFRRSTSVWLQTYAGCWFIPLKDEVLFLWPELGDETYKVAVRPMHDNGGKYLMEGVDLVTAMSWAEQEADEREAKNGRGMSLRARNAAWRKRPAPPTDHQVAMAGARGLDTTGRTKVEVSDMLSIHFVSAMVDRAYGVLQRKRAAA